MARPASKSRTVSWIRPSDRIVTSASVFRVLMVAAVNSRPRLVGAPAVAQALWNMGLADASKAALKAKFKVLAQ